MIRKVVTGEAPGTKERKDNMLADVMNIVGQGVTFLGGVLVVMGLVNLGMTIKDGMQGGGGQLAGAIAMIVGGGIVIGAAVYFGSLDTSFAS